MANLSLTTIACPSSKAFVPPTPSYIFQESHLPTRSMSVLYKFRNDKDFSRLHIGASQVSVGDFKLTLMRQKLGKEATSVGYDLQVCNAQTQQPFEGDDILIPKNSSLVVKRIPLPAGVKRHLATQVSSAWEVKAHSEKPQSELTEEEKIEEMMKQSTEMYSKVRWLDCKSTGLSRPARPPPKHYVCRKCLVPGHWISDCKRQGPAIKRATGIPRAFLTRADKDTPGAKMNADGTYVIAAVEKAGYGQTKSGEVPCWEEPTMADMKARMNQPIAVPSAKWNGIEIPKDLVCSECNDLLYDAVATDKCGCIFCHTCAFTAIYNSTKGTCPKCAVKGNAPERFQPCTSQREAVESFRQRASQKKEEERLAWESQKKKRMLQAPSPSQAAYNSHKRHRQHVPAPVQDTFRLSTTY